jgi:hypothetical protein
MTVRTIAVIRRLRRVLPVLACAALPAGAAGGRVEDALRRIREADAARPALPQDDGTEQA